MSIPSLEFLLGLLVLVSVFHAIPSPCGRRWLFAACSIAFVTSLIPNAWSFAALAAFVLSGYARRPRALKKNRPRRDSFAIYLTILVAAFMILKKYALAAIVLPAWMMAHPVVVVGLSYMLFRQIHFVVDVMQQQIEKFSLCSYLSLSIQSLRISSPAPSSVIRQFARDLVQACRRCSSRGHEILRAYLRIFIGVIKVSLISTYLLSVYAYHQPRFLNSADLVANSRLQTLIRFVLVFYSYPLFLYFNFSGYCDIVIAGAALVGIKMPENFDRPYLSRNVTDYWTRFHQSLGFWIRDYLFTPMYKALATRWSSQGRTFSSFPVTSSHSFYWPASGTATR